MKIKTPLILGLMAAATAGFATAQEGDAPRSMPTAPENHATHDHALHQAQMGRASPERLAEVAERSGPVMGFDLDRTLHSFIPADNGGVLTVTSRDADAAQVALVRSHLEYQANAFKRGDWANPVQIHGSEMPGLSDLMAAGNHLGIDYRPMENGGRITFVSTDGNVTAALHRWFEAQNSDHGEHAGH